jgi:cardiolipin synthase A/B
LSTIFVFKKTPHKKRLIKLFRWLVWVAVATTFYYLTEAQEFEEIQPGKVPVLYSNVCQDDLEKLFLEAMRGANQSILLIIYSLSDTKLIRALNSQAEKGIAVKVIHDVTTPAFGFQKLASCVDVQGVKMSGLMHQKILVVDQEKVWIGSANMTTESLKLHDNLVIGLINHQLAAAIDQQKSFSLFSSGGQSVEYWSLPQKGREGLKRLVELIDGAQKSVRVAMFTWTHAELTEAVIRAHQRKVKVEIILDQGQANGVCHQTLHTLLAGGVDIRLSSGLGLLHHKFAWIDEQFLMNGSANWTTAAFTRNRDCFLILHNLTEEQNEKLRLLWKKTKACSTKETPSELPALAA